VAGAVRRWNKPRPDRARHGLARGLKQVGDFSNVTVRNIGVGREPGELELVAPAGGLAGRASASETIRREFEDQGLAVETVEVPVTSLDREIADSALPEPDLVKIDVEGLELDVLDGMRGTIARHKPRLFVETAQPVDESTSARAMRGHLYCL
jgi:FkbM family methyltransferase